MRKRCAKCKKKKQIEEFYRNRAKHDGRQASCIPCQKKYHNNKWYIKNKKQLIEKNYTRKRRMRRANFKKILQMYFAKGCVDCGTKDARVLEFDHVTGVKRNVKNQKGAGVGYLVRNGYKWSTVKREIEKCVVRCRNCHQIKTGNDFNYNADVQDILEEHQKKMELYEPSQRYRCII